MFLSFPSQYKFNLSIFLFLVSSFIGQAQVFNYSANEDPYSVFENDSAFYKAFIDPTYGIDFYEKLNQRLGGDSVRNDKRGYAALGWVKDFYPNGNLLHKGYYTDGQLKIYKNYFPSGQIERQFRTADNLKSTMEKYYENGTMKSKVTYKSSDPLKWKDFYPSGNMEYMEEYNKSLEYYLSRQSFFESGQLETNLDLEKPSKKLYISQEFNKDGKLLEQGCLAYSRNSMDYIKIGKWIIYDEEGKLIREEQYVNGILNKEKTY